MPYAATVSQQTDLKPLQNARKVPEGYSPTPDEVVFEEAFLDDPAKLHWVWDAARRTIRPLTDADRLKAAKDGKRGEFTTRMHREIQGLYGEVSAVDGAWVAEALIDIVSVPRGARVEGMKSVRDKRVRGHANVAAHPGPASDVDALRWEDQ